ncbi:MAG TPA: TRAP transporter substrate-binding protein DctP [Deltaproteobacteria bacterium]|nr:TRAP transporter substrate-binding protein DctP [Deltaproteobacteria bacterium]HOI08219.1 TRAP transporter substrate-binding protein DctP [Deltaproteobacteria bacterium]
MKSKFAFCVLMAVLMFAWTEVRAEKVVLKMATIAPKGSNFMNTYEEIVRMVKERTRGEVEIKIYWGGVQGDEKDVFRKIKLGQLHGGGFMGPGLGEIVPEVRVTEIPYFFQNYEEVSYVRGALRDYMNRRFEEKGFVVLGWMDLGFIYTFSKVPLTSLEVARKQKWWTLEGEPIGRETFKALGISPISLSITDVATSLSTNMIDAANTTPYGAVAFQWYSRFKYIGEFPTTNINGATIVSKKQWDRISPENRKIIMQVGRECHARLEQATRKEDEECVKILLKSGIKVVKTGPNMEKDLKYIFDGARTCRENLVGRIYSRELLDRVIALRDEYRRTHPNAAPIRLQ